MIDMNNRTDQLFVVIASMAVAFFVLSLMVLVGAIYETEQTDKNTNETHILDDIRDCNHCPCMDVLHGGTAMEVT